MTFYPEDVDVGGIVVGAMVVVEVTGVPGAACAKALLAFVVTSIAGAVYAAYLPSFTSASRRSLLSGFLNSSDLSLLWSVTDFCPQKNDKTVIFVLPYSTNVQCGSTGPVWPRLSPP